MAFQKMAGSEPYPGTQAVLRAISLLKIFTDGQPELSLGELSRHAGLNKTTTFRLMTALESEGMVMRNPSSDAYRLGPQIIALGALAMRTNNLHSASQPELDALARSTGETASLEVLVAGERLMLDRVLIVAEVMGGHLLGATQSVGTRWPATRTSTGKVLLAHLPPDEAAAITMPDALRAQLPSIRDAGYAVANGELEENYLAMGAPVRNHDGRVIAAVSIGGPSQRLSPRLDELIEQVIGAAARISRRLGYWL